MRKLFGWRLAGPILSGLLITTPVEAALPQYRNGCLPDDEPCGAEGALPIYIALTVGFWLWCIVGQMRDEDYREAFHLVLLGVAFAGFWWAFASVWPY